MKLRYYLRGLAVGVLLATVILMIANAGNRPLTDAQIRKRALELGMIESDSVRLSALQGEPESGKESEIESESRLTDREGATDSSSNGEDAPDGEGTQGGSSNGEGTPAGDSSDSSLEVSSAADGFAGDETGREAVTFLISSGASSYSVSKDLAAAGLVEDAAAFDAFLCNNGYSKRLRTGTYEIYPGTDEEEIAQMIAR